MATYIHSVAYTLIIGTQLVFAYGMYASKAVSGRPESNCRTFVQRGPRPQPKGAQVSGSKVLGFTEFNSERGTRNL